MFEDSPVASRQGRSGETKVLPERIVPRHDRQHHTERLEGHDALGCAGDDRLVGKKARGMFGVEIAVPCALLDFGLGLGQRLAHLAHDHFGIAGLAGAQRNCHAAQQAHSFRNWGLAPGALCLGRSFQCGIDGHIILKFEAADG
ncbi:MAG: hypothetical protein J0H24_09025 [Delftia acidovorans]|nr:hypothetical protein [Delftia acidovorans]